jgi:hypothetical protein
MRVARGDVKAHKTRSRRAKAEEES